MDLFSDFERRIRAALGVALGEEALAAAGDALDKVTAEPPRDPSHGDVASNAAMVLAKPLKEKPRDLAMKLAVRLEADPDVASVSVAGPGFVNSIDVIAISFGWERRHPAGFFFVGSAGSSPAGCFQVMARFASWRISATRVYLPSVNTRVSTIGYIHA